MNLTILDEGVWKGSSEPCCVVTVAVQLEECRRRVDKLGSQVMNRKNFFSREAKVKSALWILCQLRELGVNVSFYVFNLLQA